MTLVIRNPNAGFVPQTYFGNIFEEWLGLDPLAVQPKALRRLNTRDDCVHTESLEDRHEISIAAPGLKKADFNIQLKGGKLTISYDACSEESTDIRRAFSKSAFSRSYNISRDTTPEGIKAKYSAGILKVTVNRPESEVPAEHSIKIN
jgi:HSP20 family protein